MEREFRVDIVAGPTSLSFANEMISVRTRNDGSLARISTEKLQRDAPCGPAARAQISDSWIRVTHIKGSHSSDTSHDARSNFSLPRLVRGGYDYSAKVQWPCSCNPISLSEMQVADRWTRSNEDERFEARTI